MSELKKWNFNLNTANCVFSFVYLTKNGTIFLYCNKTTSLMTPFLLSNSRLKMCWTKPKQKPPQAPLNSFFLFYVTFKRYECLLFLESLTLFMPFPMIARGGRQARAALLPGGGGHHTHMSATRAAQNSTEKEEGNLWRRRRVYPRRSIPKTGCLPGGGRDHYHNEISYKPNLKMCRGCWKFKNEKFWCNFFYV